MTTFEAFEAARRFDLVYAAAAWHWTNPASRWTQAVEMLAPGGVLALFRRQAELKDSVLSAAVDEIEEQLLPHDDPTILHPWSIEDMAAADGLIDVVQNDLPRVVTTTAADFVGRLATVSAYLILSPTARADALHRVRAVLPDQFDIDATLQLSLARRA